MNLIEVIDRNQFLKQLYPNGLKNFFLGQIELTRFDRVKIVLHNRDKPDTEISKWGLWGQDYNIITVELIGNFVNKANILNWEKNSDDVCLCEIFDTSETFLILFSGEGWKVELELKSLVYQRSSIYIL